MPDAWHDLPDDALVRYWDDLVQGATTASIDLDPAVASTIRRLGTLDDAPAPIPAFVARLRNDLLNAPPKTRPESSTFNLNLTSSPNGTAAGPMRRSAGFGGSGMLPQFATAALLVLTLIGSFIFFGPGRFNGQDQPPVFIPAISATPATPDTVEGPVAEFVWEVRGGPTAALTDSTALAFADPYYLTFDPAGNLWVPDGQNGRFQIFSPEGVFLESWGAPGKGEGEFDFRAGGWGYGSLAFDSAGNFYVADLGNSRVQKFAPDRAFLMSWDGAGNDDGEFLHPIDVAVDEQDRIYVSDANRHDIQVFDSEGNFITKWGKYGQEEGMLADPGGITIDQAGNVWVADFSNGRVQKFTSDGAFLEAWDGASNGGARFINPSDVIMDGQGRVYVVEWSGHRVQVFTADGQFLASWGTRGTDPGEFSGPEGIAFDGRGGVYISEDGSDRVQKFRLLPPMAPETPSTIAAAPTAVTGLIAESLWQSEGDPDLPLADPTNLAIDPLGNIWVADGRNSRFQIFSPEGEFLETWGTPGEAEGELDFVEPMLFGGYGAGSLAFDTAGNLYVADPGNYRIQKFGPDRSFITAWGSNGREDGQFLAILNLAVDSQGRVYVTDESRGDVQLFDGDGRFLSVWSDGAEDWLGKPSVIKIDADGTIWVTHFQKHAVQKYSPDGALLASWGERGYEEGELNNPSGLSIDDQGRVYVSEWANNRIQVFDADGTFLTMWGSFGTDQGDFVGPGGLVLDGEGNFYVVEDGTDRIQKFRLLPPLVPGLPS